MNDGPVDLRAALRAHLEDALAFGIEDLPATVRHAAAPWPVTSAPVPRSAPGPAPELKPELETDPHFVDPAGRLFAATGDDSPSAQDDSLARVDAEIAACTRCRLSTTRTRVVPGQGNPRARILFVGEAPGADEDRTGLAFVGRAGQLLTRMIQAMGLTRDEVFIANVLKCRPPENRDPAPDEAACCLPFLRRQIALIRPEVIVALGGHAVRNLLQTESSVGRLRGRPHPLGSARVVVTYHPSYLLRSPEAKKPAWEDLQLALRILGLDPPRRGGGAGA